MLKKNKWIYVVIGILIWIFRKRKENFINPNENITVDPGASPVPGNLPIKLGANERLPLQIGMSGPAVLWLQKSLNILHNAGLAEDQSFGSLTEAALKNNYKVTAAGINTLKLINQKLANR